MSRWPDSWRRYPTCNTSSCGDALRSRTPPSVKLAVGVRGSPVWTSLSPQCLLAAFTNYVIAPLSPTSILKAVRRFARCLQSLSASSQR
mmetsp:Transcript_38002/g.82333  ORF Transcript_38002/g.82333 Transcript_38002/m.82333 type:complete len:89 (+) Transcript_38002:102-368(+)